MAVNPKEQNQKQIPTLVKNSDLVREKRDRIVAASVELFAEKGFHQTSTREIARSAGFSIGSLYEYIASKEDILYLVCDAIHAEIETRLSGVNSPRASTMLKQGAHLEAAIDNYIRVCDRMQDSILLIYRETASLSNESQQYVLQNEDRITRIFEQIIEAGVSGGDFHPVSSKTMRLMAHNIVVLGHMWAFRRWFLRDQFSVDEYIQHQTSLIMGELIGQKRNDS